MFLSIIAFITLLLGIALVLAYLKYEQVKKSTVAAEKQATASEALAAPDSTEQIVTSTATTGGMLGQHRVNLGNYQVLLQPILDLLNNSVIDSFTILAKGDDITNRTDKVFPDYQRSETVYEVVYKGTPFRMAYTHRMVPIANVVPSEGLELPVVDTVEIGQGFALCMPLTNDAVISKNMDELYKLFMEVFKGAVINIETPTLGNLEKIYHVTLNGAVPDLEENLAIAAELVPDVLINASYAPLPELRVGSDIFKDVPMALRVNKQLRPALEDGENIAIIGGTGTGKTKLIEHIVAGLQGFSLLFLNSTSLKYVVSNPFLLKKACGQGKLVVVFDEAQALDSDSLHNLLQLMEGNQSMKNISFIIGLSSATPDPMLTRPGRVDHMVYLTQLSKTAARTLCQKYVDIHKKDGITCDQGKLNTLLVPNEPTFTLADVYACLGKQSRMDELLKAYSPYKQLAKKA